MAIDVHWLVQDEIIYIRYSGVITADEFKNLNRTMIQMLENSPRDRIGIINDALDLDRVSVGIADLKSIFSNTSPDVEPGWIVNVTTNRFINFIASLVTQFSKVNAATFDTIDKAFVFMIQHYATQETPAQLHERYQQLLVNTEYRIA